MKHTIEKDEKFNYAWYSIQEDSCAPDGLDTTFLLSEEDAFEVARQLVKAFPVLQTDFSQESQGALGVGVYAAGWNAGQAAAALKATHADHAFAKGFAAGKARVQFPVCACEFSDDEETLLSPCQFHKEWKGQK